MPLTSAQLALLPYRGEFGTPRPAGLPSLPPGPMPSRFGLNPLKAWRWVGVFGPDLMVCMANVRVGPARQGFYAVYDRVSGHVHEKTGVDVELSFGRARVLDRDVQIDVTISEGSGGVETATAAGGAYAWTRKQAGLAAGGRVMIGGEPRELSGMAIVDDTSGYLPHHTRWRWCAGVGIGTGGEQLAWNLVEGVHDSAVNSERTVWVDGVPAELAPTRISDDLCHAGTLSFQAEVTREMNENRILVRSRYRQPFGMFSGSVGGLELATGYGVMEDHDAHW